MYRQNKVQTDDDRRINIKDINIKNIHRQIDGQMLASWMDG